MTTLEHTVSEQTGIKLNTHSQLTPFGSLKDCDNIVIGRAGTFASRRGLKIVGSALNTSLLSGTGESTPPSTVEDSPAPENSNPTAAEITTILHKKSEPFTDIVPFNNDFVLTTRSGMYYLPLRLITTSEHRFSLADLERIDSDADTIDLIGSFSTETSFYYYKNKKLRRYTPSQPSNRDGDPLLPAAASTPPVYSDAASPSNTQAPTSTPSTDSTSSTDSTPSTESTSPAAINESTTGSTALAELTRNTRQAIFFRPPAPYCRGTVTIREGASLDRTGALELTRPDEELTAWLGVGHAVAYRVAWTCSKENNTVLRSQPSPRTVVTNTKREAVIPVLEIIPPATVTIGDSIEIYASAVAETGVPDDDLRLVRSERITETVFSTLMTSRADENKEKAALRFIDATGKRLYYNLYTNATEEGIENENTPAPYAAAVTLYKNYVVYGNTTMRGAVTIELKEGTVFRPGDQIAIRLTTGEQFSVVALGDKNTRDRFVITDVLRTTCYNLVAAINRHHINTFVHAFIYEADGYFTLHLESLEAERGFEIKLTNALGYAREGEFYPDITKPILALPYHNPSEVMISKAFVPEAVPYYRKLQVGATYDPIITLIANRDYLYIFKKSGLYRLTGTSYETMSIKRIETALTLVTAGAVTVFEGTLYYLSWRGVVAVRYDESEVISEDINAALLPQLAKIDTTQIQLCSYTSTQHLLLALPKYPYKKSIELVYVFDLRYKAWTKWTLREIKKWVCSGGSDKLIALSPHHVFVEKQNYNDYDYSDIDLNLIWSGVRNVWRREMHLTFDTRSTRLAFALIDHSNTDSSTDSGMDSGTDSDTDGGTDDSLQSPPRTHSYTIAINGRFTASDEVVRDDEQLLYIKIRNELPLSLPTADHHSRSNTIELPAVYPIKLGLYYKEVRGLPMYEITTSAALTIYKQRISETDHSLVLTGGGELRNIPIGIPSNFLPYQRLNFASLTVTGTISYTTFITQHAEDVRYIETTAATSSIPNQGQQALIMKVFFNGTVLSRLLSANATGFIGFALGVGRSTAAQHLIISLRSLREAETPWITVGTLHVHAYSYTVQVRQADIIALLTGQANVQDGNEHIDFYITRTDHPNSNPYENPNPHESSSAPESSSASESSNAPESSSASMNHKVLRIGVRDEVGYEMVRELSTAWAERYLGSIRAYLYEGRREQMIISKQYANLSTLPDFPTAKTSTQVQSTTPLTADYFKLAIVNATQGILLTYDPLHLSFVNAGGIDVFTTETLNTLIGSIDLTVTIKNAENQSIAPPLRLTRAEEQVMQPIELVDKINGQRSFDLNFACSIAALGRRTLSFQMDTEITRGIRPEVLNNTVLGSEEGERIPLVLYKKTKTPSPPAVSTSPSQASPPTLTESAPHPIATTSTETQWQPLVTHLHGQSQYLQYYYLIPAEHEIIVPESSEATLGDDSLSDDSLDTGGIITATAAACEAGPFIGVAILGDLQAIGKLSGYWGDKYYALNLHTATRRSLAGLVLGTEKIRCPITFYALPAPITKTMLKNALLSLEPLMMTRTESRIENHMENHSAEHRTADSNFNIPATTPRQQPTTSLSSLSLRYDNIKLKLYAPITRTAYYNTQSLGTPALIKELQAIHLNFITTNSYQFKIALETNQTLLSQWYPIKINAHRYGYNTEPFGSAAWGGSLFGETNVRILAPRTTKRHHQLRLAWRDMSLNRSFELSSMTLFYTLPPQEMR
ncbi:hypothetical protein COTS27_01041 [Spirochaetota bacterium]|nr:hypothetical protein COTS27_01041 [Spirochaetota bacterium]